MCDSPNPVKDLDDFFDRHRHNESRNQLQNLDELIDDRQYEKKVIDDLLPPESQQSAPPPAKKAKGRHSTETWVNRDSDGNIIYKRPRSTANSQMRVSIFIALETFSSFFVIHVIHF